MQSLTSFVAVSPMPNPIAPIVVLTWRSVVV
jgi:hypothetical protein